MPPLGILARLFVPVARLARQFLPLGFLLPKTDRFPARVGRGGLFLPLEFLLGGGRRRRHRLVDVGKTRSHLRHPGERNQVQAQPPLVVFVALAGATAAAVRLASTDLDQFSERHVRRNGNRLARKGPGGHVVHPVELDVAGCLEVYFHHAVPGFDADRLRGRRVRVWLEGILDQLDLVRELRRQKDGDLSDDLVVAANGIVVVAAVFAASGPQGNTAAGNLVYCYGLVAVVAADIHRVAAIVSFRFDCYRFYLHV
mmetsp:Transcript_19618/g.40209  ORF Transcript_19618/g.40209 Transcript_19618/m.40209 type:complete len:256 (-) Transcript_19618:94-861(-)